VIGGYELRQEDMSARLHIQRPRQSEAHRDERAVQEEVDVSLVRREPGRGERDDPSDLQSEAHRDRRRASPKDFPLKRGEKAEPCGTGWACSGGVRANDGRQEDGEDQSEDGQSHRHPAGLGRKAPKGPAPNALHAYKAEEDRGEEQERRYPLVHRGPGTVGQEGRRQSSHGSRRVRFGGGRLRGRGRRDRLRFRRILSSATPIAATTTTIPAIRMTR
jgi:hypothetical protein